MSALGEKSKNTLQPNEYAVCYTMGVSKERSLTTWSTDMQLIHGTFISALDQARQFIKGNKAAQDSLGEPSILMQIVESRDKFYLETNEDAGLMIRAGEMFAWSYSEDEETFHDDHYENQDK